jgi:hypothetical protein
MTVLLYNDWRDLAGARLRIAIRHELPGVEVQSYSSLDALALRLRTPGDQLVVAAVLMPPESSDLQACASLIPLLSGLKVLLVLPDHYAETIALGHRLRPSLVTFSDGDPAKVCAVLGKLIARSTPAPTDNSAPSATMPLA